MTSLGLELSSVCTFSISSSVAVIPSIVIAIVTGIVVILVVKKCTGNSFCQSFGNLVGVTAFEVFLYM